MGTSNAVNRDDAYRETAYRPIEMPKHLRSSTITSTDSLRKQPSWWSRATLDNWAWELGAAVLCLCILATIAGLLFGFNNRPLPDLPDVLSVNSIVAFLSTFAKSSLLVVLAAALRQEKWLWLVGGSRPLTNVDAFDEASRGPFGSLMLIFHRLGSFRTSLLALVTFLSLGFEVFVQQLVLIEMRPVPAAGRLASIRTPTSYNESFTNSIEPGGLSLDAMIGAFGGAGGIVPNPVCPTGNCTWPDYNTLALCTVCEDMTDQVAVSGDPYVIDLSQAFQDYLDSNNTSVESVRSWAPTFAFPNGNSYNATVTLNLVSDEPLQWEVIYPRRIVWPLNIDPTNTITDWQTSWVNDTFAGLPMPLFAMGYLDLELAPDYASIRVQRGTQCSFQPCVRTMRSAVRGDRFDNEVLHTDYGTVHIQVNQNDGTITSGWTAEVNGTEYAITERGTSNVSGHVYLLIQALRLALEGNTTYQTSGYWYGNGNDQNFEFNGTSFNLIGGPWSSTGQQAIDSSGNFTDVVDGVGRALTGRFQQLQTSVVEGTVLESQAFLNVRWEWISFPLGLVILGMMGMWLTMWSTRRNGISVWKESSLPFLYRVAGDNQFSARTPVDNVEKSNLVSYITQEADGDTIRLTKRDGIWTLDPTVQPKTWSGSSFELRGTVR